MNYNNRHDWTYIYTYICSEYFGNDCVKKWSNTLFWTLFFATIRLLILNTFWKYFVRISMNVSVLCLFYVYLLLEGRASFRRFAFLAAVRLVRIPSTSYARVLVPRQIVRYCLRVLYFIQTTVFRRPNDTGSYRTESILFEFSAIVFVLFFSP